MKRLILGVLVLLAFAVPADAHVATIKPGVTRRIPCYENPKSILVQTMPRYGSVELHLDSYWTGSGGQDDWTTFYHLGGSWAAEGQADQGPDTWIKKTLIRNAGSRWIRAYWPRCT